MKILGLLVMFLHFQGFAMPEVFDCELVNEGDRYLFKGLDRVDSGDGFKSYTMVNMKTEQTKVLSAGILGEDKAQGFVAFDGYMDQFSQSILDRMCTNETKDSEVKTLALDLGEDGSGNPMCFACVAQ